MFVLSHFVRSCLELDTSELRYFGGNFNVKAFLCVQALRGKVETLNPVIPIYSNSQFQQQCHPGLICSDEEARPSPARCRL